MHVTVTCYKQLSVNRQRTDEHPVFLGPIYLHDNSDFESYCQFFNHLKMKLCSSPLDRLVIGSDDERALVKAITTAFPESTHVLCTRHHYTNTKQKLKDDGVNDKNRTDILDMIFRDGGILDSDDSICFDEKCDRLENHCREISQNFVKYFQDRLRPQMKTKVNDPSLSDKVDGHWTNNNCESMNHVLKQAIDWKSKPLTDLVETLHSLVQGQFLDLRSAIIGAGEFRLAQTHSQFQLTKSVYVDMTDEQRRKHFVRFRRHPYQKPGYMTSTDGQSTIIAPRTHGKKPGQRKRKINTRTVTVKKPKTG
ncbi:uncharacterized protein LOC132746904 [Ruditapes philippinarum]|uniref:uncharacterized protein LOC132746904 n=1 Tax=Ruditapes philippinarum TaxID=129788 RepID=UPI00295B3BC7|nr:uncharacterized protein LOC132746904 [Ruditapes philippinarum]